MKPKTLLVLALLTALLGGYIYFFEQDMPSTDEARELEKKVLTLEPDDVTAMTLRSGERTVRLQRIEPKRETESETDDEPSGETEPEVEPEPEQQWRITAPLDARADRAEIDQLLSELTGLQIERTLDQVDTAAAGLDEPRAEVTLTTDDGESTLAVGVEVPLSSDALVRVTGDEGARIVQTGFGESLLEKVGREAGEWRDKRLFFGRRADVLSLSWTGADGERVVLLRRGDGETFWLESPIQDRADADRVRGLLSSLVSLEASSFVDAEPSSSEFPTASAFEVSLEGGDQPWRLELGDTEPDSDSAAERLARVDGQWVRLEPGPVVEAVGSAASDWRSRAWTHLQTFQIDEAIFEQAGEELLALRRDDSDWLRATNDAARVSEVADGELLGDEIPYIAASNVLYPITDASAESLGDSPPTSKPLLIVTLVGKDGEETLRLFPSSGEGDGSYLATSDDREAVLELPAETVDEILVNLQTLRDAEPVQAEPVQAEPIQPEPGP